MKSKKRKLNPFRIVEKIDARAILKMTMIEAPVDPVDPDSCWHQKICCELGEERDRENSHSIPQMLKFSNKRSGKALIRNMIKIQI